MEEVYNRPCAPTLRYQLSQAYGFNFYSAWRTTLISLGKLTTGTLGLVAQTSIPNSSGG